MRSISLLVGEREEMEEEAERRKMEGEGGLLSIDRDSFFMVVESKKIRTKR